MILAAPWYLAATIAGVAQVGVIAAVSGVSDDAAEKSSHAIALAAKGLLLDEAVARTVHEKLESGAPGKSQRLPDQAPTAEASARRPRQAAAPSRGPKAHEDATVRVRILFQGLQTRPVQRSDLVGVAMAANPPLALVLAVQVLATGDETGETVGGVSTSYEKRGADRDGLERRWRAIAARGVRARSS